MFGQVGIGSGNLSSAANRMYRIEVEGMTQYTDPDRISYPIRSSGTSYITVSYNRMNEQLRRINRLGGKIVSIKPLSLEGESEPKMEASTANQYLKGSGKPKSVGADEN